MKLTYAMKQVEARIDRPLLEEMSTLYLDKELSTREIGEELGISTAAARNWLIRLNIPIRNSSESRRVVYSKMSDEDKKEITRKANQTAREMIARGEWIPNVEHLLGDKNPAKRPESRRKISEYKTANNPMHIEEYAMKMRKSMEEVLRKRATPEELRLKEALASVGLDPKFQHAVCKAVVDFAFIDLKIAVELDGGRHVTQKSVVEKDRKRDAELEENGWILLRFMNKEIEDDIDGCIKEVLDVVDANRAIYERYTSLLEAN